MDLFNDVSYEMSQLITRRYSTSFGWSTRLFPISARKHIYAIYGLVRIADEVVDSYRLPDAQTILDNLEKEIYTAIERGYSPNPIVHAFSLTAKIYGIDSSLIAPFFHSMAMDITPQTYRGKNYKEYIHGSAEVVGLMCLRVFCGGDFVLYKRLEAGASSLGSAYQKVNFLRDLASDSKELGRIYFPGYTFETFDEKAKQAVIDDIENDFHKAQKSLLELPKAYRLPVLVSYEYYRKLLEKLKAVPVDVIKTSRIRVPNYRKLLTTTITVLKNIGQS